MLAKSYSSILSPLSNTRQIDEVFRRAEEQSTLNKKAKVVTDLYHGDDPQKRKITPTLLESLMFYSGFYPSLYWSSRAKMTNSRPHSPHHF